MTHDSASRVAIVSKGKVFSAVVCFSGALIEGYDVACAGLTASKFAQFYGMDPVQLGTAFSASTLGMLVGAIIGGLSADRIDRRVVLAIAFMLLGISTLATAVAPDTATFIALRALTGVSIGAAIVTIISVASALGPDVSRTTRVTMIFSGMSAGGVVVALLAAYLKPDYNWRLIFVVGGIAPLLLSVVALWKVPPLLVAAKKEAVTPVQLFQEGRAVRTVALWAMCFGTLLTLHLLLNWLPSLVMDFGRTARESALVSAAFHFAAITSAWVLAWLVLRRSPRLIFLCCYGGALGGMLLMILSQGNLLGLFAGSIAIGFCLNGIQHLIYGVGASLYPAEMVGTGMGFATGVGRLGSMVGPFIGGLAYALGGGAFGTLLMTVPPIGLALAASVVMLSEKRSEAVGPEAVLKS